LVLCVRSASGCGLWVGDVSFCIHHTWSLFRSSALIPTRSSRSAWLRAPYPLSKMPTNLLATDAILRRAPTKRDTLVKKVALLGTLLTLIDPYSFTLVRTHGAQVLGVFLSQQHASMVCAFAGFLSSLSHHLLLSQVQSTSFSCRVCCLLVPVLLQTNKYFP